MNEVLIQPLFEHLTKILQNQIKVYSQDKALTFAAFKSKCLAAQQQSHDALYKSQYSANSGIYVLKSTLFQSFQAKHLRPQNNQHKSGQQQNEQIWDGIYVVRSGPYKNGKFKFRISFDTFPRRPPKLYFMSQVNHPKIQSDSGLLILPYQLNQTWKYSEKHYILTIIQYLRILFLDPHFFLNYEGLNKFQNQQKYSEIWYLKAKESVFNSNNQLFINYENSCLKFAEYKQEKKNEEIVENLKELCEKKEEEDGRILDKNKMSFQQKKEFMIRLMRKNWFKGTQNRE